MQEIMEALKEVIDPELGFNIIDLGLVYEVKKEGNKVKVKMTLTTPLCPLGGFVVGSVEEKIRELGFEPEVELVFDPPWTPERMSPELRKRFGLEEEKKEEEKEEKEKEQKKVTERK